MRAHFGLNAQSLLRRTVIFSGIAVVPFAAMAQSFDCKKASTPVEHAICDHIEYIGKEDAELGRVFGDALRYSSPSVRSTLLLEQRKWLADRDEQCKPAPYILPDNVSLDIAVCLHAMYSARLYELRGRPPFTPDSSGMVGYCAGPPCCSYERSSCSEADNQRLIERSRIVSGERTFCTRLMKSHWKYYPLSESHTVTEEEASDFLSLRGARTNIAEQAGSFDINNDGRVENLAWVTAYSGAGQGCNVEMYVEMNSDRTHLIPSALTKLLGYENCETYQRAFPFEGRTYIENRQTLKLEQMDFMFPDVLTEVFVIEGEKKRSVCNFSLGKNNR
jgi:uncharacterized protein YecT (DUF1311 family)